MNKLFDPNESRLTIFPIKYPNIWDFRNKPNVCFLDC